jgi:hypothetical protein
VYGNVKKINKLSCSGDRDVINDNNILKYTYLFQNFAFLLSVVVVVVVLVVVVIVELNVRATGIVINFL